MRRHLGEPIENYIARFRHMKSKCFTPIPKAKMVKMVINGLQSNIRKKLVRQQFPNLAQLSDRVRWIENFRMGKEYIRKDVNKERIAYIDFLDSVETNEGEVQESFMAAPMYLTINMVDVKEWKYLLTILKSVEVDSKPIPVEKDDQI